MRKGKKAEDNMIAKRAKRVENNKDPTTVTNDHIHGVPFVQISLDDIIPAPLHNFTGLITLLFCELETKCPNVKERLKRTL